MLPLYEIFMAADTPPCEDYAVADFPARKLASRFPIVVFVSSCKRPARGMRRVLMFGQRSSEDAFRRGDLCGGIRDSALFNLVKVHGLWFAIYLSPMTASGLWSYEDVKMGGGKVWDAAGVI